MKQLSLLLKIIPSNILLKYSGPNGSESAFNVNDSLINRITRIRLASLIIMIIYFKIELL